MLPEHRPRRRRDRSNDRSDRGRVTETVALVFPVLANPPRRGNPVSSLFVIARKVLKRTDAAIQSVTLRSMPGRYAGIALASAGLPRQASAFLAMTTQKHGE